MKPILATGSIRLVPVSRDDLDAICTLLHGPQVREFLCDDRLLPRETVAGLVERSVELDAAGLGLWMIQSDEGAGCGLCGLQPMSEEAARAAPIEHGIEPTIALEPAHWGRGIATGALQLLARHAVDRCGIARLVAVVDAPNERSQRLIRGCRFREVGRGPGPRHTLVYFERSLIGHE